MRDASKTYDNTTVLTAFIFAVGGFELLSKVIMMLESMGDFSSILYIVLMVGLSLSLMIGVQSSLTLHSRAEKSVMSNLRTSMEVN